MKISPNIEYNAVDLVSFVLSNQKIELDTSAVEAIVKANTFLLNKIEASEKPIYGINTGFGSLYDKEIKKEDLSLLQYNLLRSHACGMGDKVDINIVKLMLLLKIIGLSYGYSGVQLSTVEQLVLLYNKEIIPVVYELGSLGASGDLAPLAHLSLPLIGEGEVYFKGEIRQTKEVFKDEGIQIINLGPKEGLALINGTQFMSAHACYLLYKSKNALQWSDLIAATSLEAYDGRPEPFTNAVHQIRAHHGQIQTAQNIREILKGSELIAQEKIHVQDPYCIRCVPQVHGASKDTFLHVLKVVNVEINSVTDNPNVIEDEDAIISAGNFHGQPLALVLDFLAIAMSEIASISERRVYKLLGAQRGLPAFLVKNPGLDSGFMIAQYAAAAVVSQNKTLCMPASVDTIDSSNGQEDHVSMGANAATKCLRVLNNVDKVLGIELFTASQAISFRDKKSSPLVEEMLLRFRNLVPLVSTDRFMHPDLQRAQAFINLDKGAAHIAI